MVSRAANLLEQLFALPESERNAFLAGLAERLPDAGGRDPFQSTQWQVELARRIDDIASNPDMFEDWETAEKELLAKYPKQ